jgi:hypothetical protein
VRTSTAFVAGLAFAFVAWLVVMPWDLSEGTPGEGAEAPLLVLIGVVVVSVFVVARLRAREAAPFAIGTWTATIGLFFWRNAVSDTDGLWVMALMVLVPGLAIAVAIARNAGRAVHDRARMPSRRKL